MENISKHISYEMGVRSLTAKKFRISNIPSKQSLQFMKELAENIYEPIIEVFGEVVLIHSFYRCQELNTKLGGSKTSQHMAKKGAAIDIDAQPLKKVPNKTIFNFIKDWLDFDQLIWEKGDEYEPDWIHVSYNKGKNRNQIIYNI